LALIIKKPYLVTKPQMMAKLVGNVNLAN